MVAPLVAKAMFDKAKEAGGCDLALVNAGGVRDGLLAGEITLGELYGVLPFGNTLVIVTLQGDEIRAMLEDAIARAWRNNAMTGAFPYLAGARMTIDPNAPVGRRLVSLERSDGMGGWLPLEAGRQYKVATFSFLAQGGDGYRRLAQSMRRVDTGFVDIDLFLEYLRAHDPLPPYDDSDAPVSLVEWLGS
jgi:5'-nucleotidase